MEKWVSDSEKSEHNAMALEDSTSSYEENQGLICDHCTSGRSSGLCTCPNTVGVCSCPPNAAPSPSCVFYSPRIQGLLLGEKTEFDTAREHWTVVDAKSEAEAERIAEDNRKYFDEVLVKHPKWGAFFSGFEDLEVGAQIGEGGQAEIFEAKFRSNREDCLWMVAKVWKAGVSLKDLEQQWPSQRLSNVAQGSSGYPFGNIKGAAFIRDGDFKNRFAFVMKRWWGDLRTFIDQRMLQLLHNNNHGPPFKNIKDVLSLIWETSNDLLKMHKVGVLHRDVKASNVLLGRPSTKLLLNSMWTLRYDCAIVIDYECSVGVTGTGFWRAPEILEQVQGRVPINDLVFTKEADIYSFGMMCYEIITGRIPFEGHPQNDYSIVLRGGRPELPHDIHPNLKKLVLDCWQHDPQLRPTFAGIGEGLKRLDLHLGIDLGQVFDSGQLCGSN